MSLKKFQGSLSMLIVAFLVVFAFFRGEKQDAILLIIMLSWVLFLVVMIAKSIISNTTYGIGSYLLKLSGRAGHGSIKPIRIQELVAENATLKEVILAQVEYQISERVGSIDSAATWKWQQGKYLENLLEGNCVKIALSGIKDYNSCEVILGHNGKLDIQLAKVITLDELKNSSQEDEKPENSEIPQNAVNWFNNTGKTLLAKITTELNQQGHSYFYLSKSGTVSIDSDSKKTPYGKQLQLPKTQLKYICSLFESMGLETEMAGGEAKISWN